MAAAAPQHRFETEWTACGAATFVRPTGVAVDTAGDVYVTDASNGDLFVLGPEGQCLTSVSGLLEPTDLAVDSSGVVYVLVASPPPFRSRGQLLRLSPSKFPPDEQTTYSAPSFVAEGGEGSNLKSVAVDLSSDRVYLNAEIHVSEFGPASEGNALLDGTIGEGILFEAFGVAVDEATHDVLVTDRRPNDEAGPGIYRFDAGDGHLISVINGSSRPQGAFQIGAGSGPRSLDIDQSTGDLLVWDAGLGLADEFKSDGSFVTQIGPNFGAGATLAGAERNQLAVSNGASSPTQGNVYVASEDAPPRVYVFGPLEEPRPVVQTQAATEVTPSTANLHGTLDPSGLPVTACRFEYVPAATFETSGFASAAAAPCAETLKKIGSGASPVPVHLVLGNVEEQPYVFRLVAENENGSAAGSALRFGPPVAETLPAGSVEFTEATMRGSLEPNGLETHYFFEYGETETYGRSTASTSLAAEAGPTQVSAVLTGLLPDHTYHYRIVASNEAGLVQGEDRTVTLADEPKAETCPNSEFRVGSSASLPECRAYELVSPPYTNGLGPSWLTSQADWGNFTTALSDPTGDSVIFETFGTIPGTPGAGTESAYRETREPNGWSSHFYGPADLSESPFAGGVSPDHLYSFWQAASVNGFQGESPGLVEPPRYLFGPGGSEPIGVGSLGVDLEAEGRFITAGAAHVIFVSKIELESGAAPDGELTIYDRSPGAATRVVSLLPGGSPGKATELAGISKDGSTVAFTAEGGAEGRRLYVRRGGHTFNVAPGDAKFAGLADNGHILYFAQEQSLFAYMLNTESRVPIAPGANATFVNVSADGSHAYFTSASNLTADEQNQLGDSAVEGQPNLYGWTVGTEALEFVAVLDPLDLAEFGGHNTTNLASWTASLDPLANGNGTGPAQDPSRTTPDGHVLVFQSHGDLTGYDSGGTAEIFRFESGGPLSCISCPFGLASSEARFEVNEEDSAAPLGSATTALPNVSTDGRRVFFQTADPLVSRDLNGKLDVYEWHDGQVSLISSGHSTANSYLYAMSPDGSDVFFTTTEGLAPADDVEVAVSLYDARVNGGVPPPPRAVGPCADDACQGAASQPPSAQSPLSEAIGPEPPTRQRHRRCRKRTHKVRRHGKVRCAKGHRHRGLSKKVSR